jgi:CDP-diacylglycerol---glycerol-3-phosphate 3-phosphatidyltransferase
MMAASHRAEMAVAAPPEAPHETEQASLSFEQIFRSLARYSRVFPLHSEHVTIIPTPTAFYDQLVANIRRAQHRITISSLYLGTGELERKLVDAIADKLRENPDIQVKIVLDYSRGQRGGQDRSSVTMFKQLLKQFPNNLELYLYKVPQLKGIKASLPPPFNETIGVSHAKVYLVDDTLILSGANLSEDYFTNRQDRYVQMAQCEGLATFYHEFVGIIAAFSYQAKLDRGGQSGDYVLDSPAPRSESKKVVMKREFEEIVSNQKHREEATEFSSSTSSGGHDTWAFPTIQFTPINVTHDEVVLSELLRQVPDHSSLGIASGYLNFPPFLDELLVNCGAHLDVLTAAPEANGFFNANGIKGALPMAYSLIEQEFYEKTRSRKFVTNIREYNYPGWTFHGKGMWFSPSVHSPPQLTIVGSSNFGRRSYGCDLESQLVMFTRSPVLRQKLHDEYQQLTQPAELVSDQVWTRTDRSLNTVFCWKYGHWIRPVSKMIAAYL